MIKIRIEQITKEPYTETVEFVTERTPTEHREKDYNHNDKVVFAEKREPREVTKYRDRTVKLLEQEIENDSEFDLTAVVRAIFKLQ